MARGAREQGLGTRDVGFEIWDRLSSPTALDGVEHAFEHFQLLIQPGDFQNLAIHRVGRGDLQVAVGARAVGLASQAAPSGQRCRSLRWRRDRAPRSLAVKPPQIRRQRGRLVGAQFLRGVDDGHVAENFGGQIHESLRPAACAIGNAEVCQWFDWLADGRQRVADRLHAIRAG